MRDGHAVRRGDALRVALLEHRRDLLARKPARILKLIAVDDDVARRGAGETADHQRSGERPGLRGDIAHLVADNAALLADLAPHRLLDRLAGFEKAGQRRIHALGKARLPAEQATFAVDAE